MVGKGGVSPSVTTPTVMTGCQLELQGKPLTSRISIHLFPSASSTPLPPIHPPSLLSPSVPLPPALLPPAHLLSPYLSVSLSPPPHLTQQIVITVKRDRTGQESGPLPPTSPLSFAFKGSFKGHGVGTPRVTKIQILSCVNDRCRSCLLL